MNLTSNMTSNKTATTNTALTLSKGPSNRPYADGLAADMACAVQSGTLPATKWNHRAFLLTTIHLVRECGAGVALEQLRPIVRDRGVPRHDVDGSHETLLVFYVWAVERLLAAGRSTVEVLWHPLVDARSPLAWYSRSVLESAEARDHFVISDRAVRGEPAPHPPITECVARVRGVTHA